MSVALTLQESTTQLTAAARAMHQARLAIAAASARDWDSPAARTYRTWYADLARAVFGAQDALAQLTRTCRVFANQAQS